MIFRTITPILRGLAEKYPVVTVTGPRQSGKTTVCRAVFPDKPYVNLESPDVRGLAQNDPRGFFAQYPDGAILDEIQRVPELTSWLQPMVDEDDRPGRFILTGSQQFEVMTSINQSLAGRTALLKLLPLSIEELHNTGLDGGIDRLLLSGFYPRIHHFGLDPTQAIGDYVQTYVERDIRQLVNIKDLALFERFIRICAGRVGQLLNLQSLGNDVGVSHTTARNWITLLQASYIVFLLQPWHTNLTKRQVKSPKLYFYDVGLAAWLLGAENEVHINRHPLRGNLFENLVVIDILKHRYNRGKRGNLYFWRDARGNEIDLLLEYGPEIAALEIKAGATITEDWFKGLRTFTSRLPEPPKTRALIHGGKAGQKRTDVTVYTVSEIAELMDGLER